MPRDDLFSVMGSNPTPHLQSKLESRRPPSPLQNGALPTEDPFTRLHKHDHLICISDRVDQTLIFPFIQDGPLLDRVVDTILNGTSVLVVGGPGIGKRTLSLGVARRFHEIRQSGVNNAVASRKVYTLSLGRGFWTQAQGAAVTAMQNKIRQVFRLVEQAGPEKIVFCIDDVDVLNFVDTLVMKQRRRERPLAVRDATEPILSTENMLRFLLFSKKVLCLCTCIKAAYNRLVTLDTYYDEKFSKSFRVFHMAEPSIPHSSLIVTAHRERIEAELDVMIQPDAINASVAYAITFLAHRNMPEKAIDLLNEASITAVQKVESSNDSFGPYTLVKNGRPVVTRTHVDSLIRGWCGVGDNRLRQSYDNIQAISAKLKESSDGVSSKDVSSQDWW